MVARPCRSRTRAYTAEGAHPGLRRCLLVPLPRRGPRQRGSGSDESSPPAPRVESARNPSWFLQAVLTHFRSQAHRHLPPASKGPGISAPSPTIRSGGLHGQTCQGPGALHFYYSGCYLLSAFYFPGVQFKYCYVILFYLCKP